MQLLQMVSFLVVFRYVYMKLSSQLSQIWLNQVVKHKHATLFSAFRKEESLVTHPIVTSNMLLPIELDTAMSPKPFLATRTLVMRSGMLVPAARKVRPMTYKKMYIKIKLWLHNTKVTGHFWVPTSLCFKSRQSAKPLTWKWFLFLYKWNLFSPERFCT